MTELTVEKLLETDTVSLQDFVCRGECRHKSAEECAGATHLVFTYRGAYVRHLGSDATVAEANQVLFFNQGESYRVSHPVKGGDACVSMTLSAALLQELVPKAHVREAGGTLAWSWAFPATVISAWPSGRPTAALLRSSSAWWGACPHGRRTALITCGSLERPGT